MKFILSAIRALAQAIHTSRESEALQRIHLNGWKPENVKTRKNIRILKD